MLGLKGFLLVMLKSAFIVAFFSIPKPVIAFSGLKNWSRKALYTKVDLCTQACYSQIIPGLYLGNARAAGDRLLLHELQITHVLSVQTIRLPTSTFEQTNMRTLFIRAYDSYDTKLLPFFPLANSFIDEGRKQGNVIVHCRLGVSRSATIVIAYLMQKYHMTFNQAFKFVRSRRPFINPNPNFVKQLKMYEENKYYVGQLNRLEAYMKVNSGENKYKVLYSVLAAVGLIIPVAVLVL